MKHSKFINLVFIITSILIIWKVSTFFSSQFTDPTFQIGEFQLNVLFTIVGIFGGVVVSIFFHYASKFRDQYFEYQQLTEEWREIKHKILSHKKDQTFEQNSVFLEEKQLEGKKIASKLVYLVMSIFMTLLVWFVSQIHHANQFHLLSEYVYALLILAGTFTVFIFGWYSFEKGLNSSKNRNLLINHYMTDQKIYLYKFEYGNPKTD